MTELSDNAIDKSLKILIADDDALDRMTVRRALKAADLKTEIVEADSCASAIAALTQADFDCAFLDYRFPDGDGLSAVQEARAAGVRTPIVMLTGHGGERVAADMMKAGA